MFSHLLNQPTYTAGNDDLRKINKRKLKAVVVTDKVMDKGQPFVPILNLLYVPN